MKWEMICDEFATNNEVISYVIYHWWPTLLYTLQYRPNTIGPIWSLVTCKHLATARQLMVIWSLRSYSQESLRLDSQGPWSGTERCIRATLLCHRDWNCQYKKLSILQFRLPLFLENVFIIPISNLVFYRYPHAYLISSNLELEESSVA
jgi:hypothetical protein